MRAFSIYKRKVDSRHTSHGKVRWVVFDGMTQKGTQLAAFYSYSEAKAYRDSMYELDKLWTKFLYK